jgi:hypothetical protein
MQRTTRGSSVTERAGTSFLKFFLRMTQTGTAFRASVQLTTPLFDQILYYYAFRNLFLEEYPWINLL